MRYVALGQHSMKDLDEYIIFVLSENSLSSVINCRTTSSCATTRPTTSKCGKTTPNLGTLPKGRRL